jgi:Xaa-Pro dipeptidase
MHKLAEHRILEHLIKAGLIIETPIEELIEKRVSAVFFPHGLGHFIGLRVHDVGGYAPGHPEKLKHLAGLRSLRTRRILKAGMAITVEPGCYFNELIIRKAFEDPEIAKYLVKEKV